MSVFIFRRGYLFFGYPYAGYRATFMSDECQTNVRKERFIAGKHMKGAGIYVAQFYVVRGCTPLSPDNYLVEYLLISPWSIY